jgi:hypothetical protein
MKCLKPHCAFLKSRRPLLERLEDRVVPSIAAGTILVANFPSSLATPPLPPTGIIGVNPSTGAQFPVSTGGQFSKPTYICEAPNGQLYVSDFAAGASGTGAIIRVDPNTGTQTLLATGGPIDGPNVLAFLDGFIYVANEGDGTGTIHTIVRLDPNVPGGNPLLITDGPHRVGGGTNSSFFTVPTGMAPVPGSNAVYVSDEQGSFNSPPPLGMVWEVNVDTGVQTPISSNNPTQGMLFDHPVDLALEPSGNIIVANTGDPSNNVTGSVFRLNPQTGVQSPLGPGVNFGPFSGTDSVQLGPDGTIFVGAILGNVPGHVTTVDPVTGVQNTLASDDNLSSVEGMQIFHAAVQLAATTTSVASSVNPSVVGQSVTFTATVTANAPGGGTPTGTVQFLIDGINFGNPVTLSGGQATSSSISSLAVGGHTVTASYSGDGSFATSTGSLSGGQTVHAEAAPTVACSVAESLLWPPNNKLANVGLSVTVTTPDVSVEVLVYATDNASPSDAADIGPGTLQLRSQRQGNGDGRVYLIVAVVSDPAATGFDVCNVVVPHDQSADSIDAVQRQAAAAEAYYRQFQTPPAGFTLLGESGGGGGASPPRPRGGETAGTSNVGFNDNRGGGNGGGGATALGGPSSAALLTSQPQANNADLAPEATAVASVLVTALPQTQPVQLACQPLLFPASKEALSSTLDPAVTAQATVPTTAIDSFFAEEALAAGLHGVN